MTLLTGLFLTPVAVQAADWKSFSNDRYGFSVDVPASFKASAPPDNNDGLTFNSPDGRVEIRAYGHLLSDGEKTSPTTSARQSDTVRKITCT